MIKHIKGIVVVWIIIIILTGGMSVATILFISLVVWIANNWGPIGFLLFVRLFLTLFIAIYMYRELLKRQKKADT